MSKTRHIPGSGNPDVDQRAALERSEKQATQTEPQNFRDHANEEKVVSVGPDLKDAPIEGIDPKDRGQRKR